MSEIIPVISATGLYTPPETVTNEELVASFNTYVERFNERNAAEIEAGEEELVQLERRLAELTAQLIALPVLAEAAEKTGLTPA